MGMKPVTFVTQITWMHWQIGGYLRNTSVLLDNGILVDAGAGLGKRGFDLRDKINQIFVSHSHFDYLRHIFFLADSVEWICWAARLRVARTTRVISNHRFTAQRGVWFRRLNCNG